MIRRKKDQTVTVLEKPQNGDGILTLRKILNGPEELDQKGRVFNHCFLSPGSGLGYHRHEGTSETMYILSGRAEYTDENGEITALEPGDMTFTDNGQGHSIFCAGENPLEFIALVLYTG